MSKYREIRLRALGDALSTCDYDLICLQEVWVYRDFQYIQTKVRESLPYSHFYFAGFLGSGLAIFSRWPIFGTSMFQFSLNGRPTAVWRGDWYAGKGVATALIRHHTGAFIEVFNSHVYPISTPLLRAVSCGIRKGRRHVQVSSNRTRMGDCKADPRCRRTREVRRRSITQARFCLTIRLATLIANPTLLSTKSLPSTDLSLTRGTQYIPSRQHIADSCRNRQKLIH